MRPATTYPLFNIPVNRSVPKQDEPRLSRQAGLIYDRLLKGEVSAVEMAQIAMQYNARIYEIRDYLYPKQTVIITRTRGNLNYYAIRPLTEANNPKRRK